LADISSSSWAVRSDVGPRQIDKSKQTPTLAARNTQRGQPLRLLGSLVGDVFDGG
jgi:hypothetical protein